MDKKRAQSTMSMPFGMIFAIFLIVVFVVFAFMAIAGFFEIGDTASVGMFYEELQDAVDEALSSQSSQKPFEINLPKGIKQVCFANLSSSSRITNPGEEYQSIKYYDIYNANTFLLPPEKAQDMQWKFIEHLDLEKITATENPYCVDVNEGLIIKKDFTSRLVYLE